MSLMLICILFVLWSSTAYYQLIFVAMAFAVVFHIISYLKSSKDWGRLLFYTRRTPLEVIFALIAMGLVLYTMLHGALNGWSSSMRFLGNPYGEDWIIWGRSVITLIALGLSLLPCRVFENGFRDELRFEAWEDVESVEALSNGRVKILLKKPTLRRTVYLNMRPGDELPAFCCPEAGEENVR